MKQDFMFTSESVTEGHPDKLCDQISDAVVDRFLQQDPQARVVAECAVATGILFIAVRFDARAAVDIPGVARQVIQQVGYEQPAFNARTCSIMTSINELDAGRGGRVDEREMSEEEVERVPARHQATVFGYACTQSAALMPLPIWLAHQLARQLAAVRRDKRLAYLGPDGKTQVGVEFRERKPHRIHSITLIASRNGAPLPPPASLRDDLLELVIRPVFSSEPIQPDEHTQICINPEEPFSSGGPAVHAGLTGRKNAIDTYGEYARHSGAALSGKDPTRIDRVGAYAARYAAKNVVAAGLAEECEVLLSYSIGRARPVSVQVDTFGTGRLPDEAIGARVQAAFDFRPAGIIRQFNLRELPALRQGGFYRKLAAYGQMGRMDLDLPWEATDRASMLEAG